MDLQIQSERICELIGACSEGRSVTFRACNNFLSAEFLGERPNLLLGPVAAFRTALSAFYRADLDIVHGYPGCVIVRYGIDNVDLEGSGRDCAHASVYSPTIHRWMRQCRVVRLSYREHSAYVPTANRSDYPADRWVIKIATR